MTSPAPLVTLPQYDDFAAGNSVKQTRLDGVMADIRRYCGWHIAPAFAETFVLDGNNRQVLMLPTLYLTAVTSVTEDGTLLAASDYEWSRDGALRKKGWGRWGLNKYRSVTVVATHGYTSVPPGITQVVLDAVSRAVAVPAGQVSEKIGPFEFRGSEGVRFYEHEKKVLDSYRIPVFA